MKANFAAWPDAKDPLLDAFAGFAYRLSTGGDMFAGRITLAITLAVNLLMARPTAAEKIRTAVPGLNLNYLSVFTAEERNFFRDEGLENEAMVIGGPAGIAALVSGDVDYSGAGGSGLRAAVKGAPLKAIMYQTEKPTWYLIVHPSITQSADLKGKKIGVALIGDSEDRFTTLFIERAGLSAKDVTKISLGTNPGDKILAIKSGGVSAVVLDLAAASAAQAAAGVSASNGPTRSPDPQLVIYR